MFKLRVALTGERERLRLLSLFPLPGQPHALFLSFRSENTGFFSSPFWGKVGRRGSPRPRSSPGHPHPVKATRTPGETAKRTRDSRKTLIYAHPYVACVVWYLSIRKTVIYPIDVWSHCTKRHLKINACLGSIIFNCVVLCGQLRKYTQNS